MKKRKLKKKSIIILLAILILIMLAIFMPSVIKKNKTNNPKRTIIGTWTTDGVTKYRFDKNNKGALIVSLGEYEFTYKIEDDKLDIDFKNERATDAKYTYKFEEDILILDGENGTFTFKKYDEQKKK